MSFSPPLPHPTAVEAASLWAAKLDGSVLTAAERAQLDAWLAADPTHRTLLSGYCQFSADLEQQMPLLAGIRELSAEIRTTPATAQLLPWLRWPLMAGVALTAAAAVALGLFLARPRGQFENFATPAAERHSITLADGTKVDLNAQTNLQIEIDAQDRRVRLAAGEAFFAVQKDPNRPFVVETPQGSVRVTGTKFDVRAETAGALEVMVLEGSVRASPAHAPANQPATVALKAGDHLVADAEGIRVRQLTPPALDDALAWRSGQIVFKDTPLHEVLARFARYHGRGLTADPEVADLRVGARFSLDDLDGFFDGLEAALPVRVARNLNGTIVVHSRVTP